MRTLADYTANDVTPETRAQYSVHVEHWQAELHPNGALECYFAAEIVRAAWRIERYAIFDSPAMTDQTRTAWLRYHDQTNLGIRRNLEELRRLQSDRYLQAHLGILLPGVASLKLVLPGLKFLRPQTATATSTATDPASGPAPLDQGQFHEEKPDPAAVARKEVALHAQIQQEERTQLAQLAQNDPAPAPQPAPPAPPPVPAKPEATRNALCPCNSGQKYKRCCGHWSKSGLKEAA